MPNLKLREEASVLLADLDCCFLWLSSSLNTMALANALAPHRIGSSADSLSLVSPMRSSSSSSLSIELDPNTVSSPTSLSPDLIDFPMKLMYDAVVALALLLRLSFFFFLRMPSGLPLRSTLTWVVPSWLSATVFKHPPNAWAPSALTLQLRRDKEAIVPLPTASAKDEPPTLPIPGLLSSSSHSILVFPSAMARAIDDAPALEILLLLRINRSIHPG
mmetsp:Transcript_13044/g.21574  ORF Transcript_13044/g.21574 Transcript_13044/m.21574 type:complete len:218 (+) Transcript_13044:229-882(+)